MNIRCGKQTVLVHITWMSALPKLRNGGIIPGRFRGLLKMLTNPIPDTFSTLAEIALVDMYSNAPISFNSYLDVWLMFADGSSFKPQVSMEGPNVTLYTAGIDLVNYSMCYGHGMHNINVVNGNIVIRPHFVTDDQRYLLENMEFLASNKAAFKIFTRHFLVPTTETIVSWTPEQLCRYQELLKKIIEIESGFRSVSNFDQ